MTAPQPSVDSPFYTLAGCPAAAAPPDYGCELNTCMPGHAGKNAAPPHPVLRSRRSIPPRYFTPGREKRGGVRSIITTPIAAGDLDFQNY